MTEAVSAVSRRDRARLGAAAAVLGVLALGAIHLNRPFHGDTALFLLGAKTMQAGGTLYLDFWDLKQPGIYLFYYAAGRLFGFEEAGIRTADLLWNGVFASVLVLAMRDKVEDVRLSLLAPFATVGVYYAFARSWHLTQLEFLVALPLFLSLALVSNPARLSAARFFWSGVCAGVVVTFKLVLAPLPIAFWIAALVYERSERPYDVGRLLSARLLPTFAGGAAVLACVLAWSIASGNTSQLLWTTFVFPLEVAMQVPANSIEMLARGMAWFVLVTLPWLALAAAHFGLPGDRKPSLFATQLALWLGIGLALIVLQKQSWWQYHFLLLVTPAGLLGVLGADRLLAYREKADPVDGRGGALRLILLIGVAPALAYWSWQVSNHASGALARTSEAVRAYQTAVSEDYARLAREVRVLSEVDAAPGPIYVMGNPLIYRLSGRMQAIPIMGWAWELQPPSMWARLRDQLDATMPPYVVVSSGCQKLIDERGPRVREFLDEHYVEIARSDTFTWYRARRSR